MLALLSYAPGGPDTLRLDEIATPEPKANEVRVAIAACGVNYPDALIIEDKYQFKPPRPFAPGFEIAGTIDALGEGVTGWHIGDRVIAHCTVGGMAEYVTVAAHHCLRMPTEMPFDVGASLLVTYGTSLHALKDRAQLKAGETLLVLGAAGGVGLAAVELGKALGARVIAAVSSEEKAALARERGAEVTLIYPREPSDPKALAKAFKDACGREGAHVIYDPIGGEYAEAALRAIAWAGRYLVVGFPAGIPRIPLNLPLLKGCDIQGVFWGSFAERHPAQHAENLQLLLDLWREGRIQPTISARFSLPQGGTALAKLLHREVLGKMVVLIGHGG
jgi:NADPH2:quinone reductase